MHFKVTQNDGTAVELSRAQLLDQLMSKVTSEPKAEHAQLSRDFVEFLQERKTLAYVNPAEVAALSFAIGYYYRVFLEKNHVEVAKDINAEVFNRADDSSGSEESRPTPG